MRPATHRPSAPRLVRNVDMATLHETWLIAAVTTVLVIRTQLWLTNYPQLGGAGLHIAHLLWGGLFMALTIGLLLTYVGPGVRGPAALLGGVGFGFFIDELGKFITADNDYFFRPAAALIYLVFIAAFLLMRGVQRRRGLTPTERVANAVDLLVDAVAHRMDEREHGRARELLSGTGRDDALVAALRRALAEARALPPPAPGVLGRLMSAVRAASGRVGRHPAFPGVLAAVFATWAALSVLTALALVLSFGFDVGTAAPGFVSDRVADLSLVNVASVASSLVSAVLVAAGIASLRRGERRAAFERFEQALLVAIFVTQTFSFVESQFHAVFGLGVAVVMLVAVRQIVAAQPRADARAIAAPVPTGAGRQAVVP
jgi:hypothetical protein